MATSTKQFAASFKRTARRFEAWWKKERARRIADIRHIDRFVKETTRLNPLGLAELQGAVRAVQKARNPAELQRAVLKKAKR
jgi:hypothetical protein